jgi:hypothetical protein
MWTLGGRFRLAGRSHLSNTGLAENLIYPTLVYLKTSFIQHWLAENPIYPTLAYLQISFIQHWFS